MAVTIAYAILAAILEIAFMHLTLAFDCLSCEVYRCYVRFNLKSHWLL